MEEKRITKNGVSVYGYKNEALHSFFISLFVRAGSMFESEEESGMTHFFEHITVRNVNSLMGDSLYKMLDARGVEFNASTFSEMVQFYISGECKSFGFGSEVITRTLAPLVLTRAEVDAERRRIKAEIREADEKNSLSAFSSEVVYSGTSLARSIIGTNKTVDKITLKRLCDYKENVLSAENIFFYVTGNYTSADMDYLLSLIEGYKLSVGNKRENLAPVPKDFMKRDGKVRIKHGDFTAIRFNFDLDMTRLSVPATDLIYDRLFSGYNSEFFIEMSEKRGIFYDVSGSSERYRNIGSLNFSYELREKDIYEAAEITVSILKSFRERLLSDGECMRAPYVDNAPLLLDDSRELNFTMAYDNKIMCLDYKDLSDRISAYESVSAEDIRDAARIIFTKENLTVTVKGNKKKIDKEALEKIIEEL